MSVIRVALIFSCIMFLGDGSSAQKNDLPQVSPITHQELTAMVGKDSGNVVAVNLWATWCKPCNEEMPALIKLNQEFSDTTFRLIVLSADESDILESTVRPRLKKLGVTFPSFIMNDRSSESFMEELMPSSWNGALALPTTIIYDRKGKVVDMLVGGQTLKRFERVVHNALKK